MPSLTRRQMVERAAAQFVDSDGNNDQPFPEFPTLVELNQELAGWTENEVMVALWPDE